MRARWGVGRVGCQAEPQPSTGDRSLQPSLNLSTGQLSAEMPRFNWS